LETYLDYYKSKWNTAFEGDENVLAAVLERAGNIVCTVVNIAKLDVNELPYYLAENVCKAVCTQADFIIASGGITNDTDINTSSNIKIGSFSISEETTGKQSSLEFELCETAKAYLNNTGLLFAGVNVT
jgi:hypothetical protein